MAARTIPIQFSYKVEYIERRHRNSDILRIACDSLIVVDEADEQEAPAVCRIEQRDCWEREVTFRVRSYKDAMWWLAGGRDGPLGVSEFVTGIGEGNAYHLGLLSGNLSPPKLAHSLPDRTRAVRADHCTPVRPFRSRPSNHAGTNGRRRSAVLRRPGLR
jgi:hypothetical protein